MQYRLIAPPRLVVEVVIFRETAHVHDAELRVDRRPSIGRWLAAIVESSPCETACQPFARCVKLPPLFSQLGPGRMVEIVGTEPVAQLIGLINASRRNRTRCFRAYAWSPRMCLVPCINDPEVVIEAHYVQLFWKVRFERLVHRRRAQPSGIELTSSLNHRVNHMHALRLRHHDRL